ncbi:MAG TPA: hypothetical protein VE994_01440 [Terriglobales bacterium]|nr:hypothetical protein [Terriglobales bacterium]
MRNVIIHYHIFKNAGSSVDRLLQDSFGTRWATFEGSTPTSLLAVHDVEDFLDRHPHVSAVSSHLARPPLPGNVDAFPIIFLRNPIDRAASVYAHEHRASSNVESSEVAKVRDFAGYVKWCLDAALGRDDGGVVIRNYQVVHLSGASFRYGHIYNANALQSDLTDVLSFLDRLPFFGIVEEFELSLQLLKRTAGRVWSDLQIANIKENVTPGRKDSLKSRLEEVRHELGSDLLHCLEEENRLDSQLHEAATAMFQSRLSRHGLI